MAEGLVSDPDGVENVVKIVLDAFFAAVLVGVSVVLDIVDDDVVDSDDVNAVVATVVVSVVVGGLDDNEVDSSVDDVDAVVATVVSFVVVVGAVDDVAAVVAIHVVSVVVGGVDDDVGTDVVAVGAPVILGGEDNDVVDVVGTVVLNDVNSGVVSAVEVDGVVGATVDGTVELFKFPIFQPSVNAQDEKHVSAVFRLFN